MRPQLLTMTWFDPDLQLNLIIGHNEALTNKTNGKAEKQH